MAGQEEGTVLTPGVGADTPAPATPASSVEPENQGTVAPTTSLSPEQEALIEKLLPEVEKRLTPKVQSVADKSASRYKRQVQAQIEEANSRIDSFAKVAEQAGKPLSQDQITAMKSKVRETAENPPPEPENPFLPDILAMQQKAGVELVDGDPELQGIVLDQGTKAYLDSIERQLAAKKARLSPASTATQKPVSPDTARGGIPTGPGRPAEHLADNSRQYWEHAHDK